MLIWVAGSSHLIVCAGVFPMLHSSVVISFPKVQQLDLEQQSIRASIRHWLQSIMADQRLSAIQLAKKAGVSPTTIYRALDVDGVFMPTTKTLEKIATKIGRPPPSLTEHVGLEVHHIKPMSSGIEAMDLRNLQILTSFENSGLVFRVTDRTLELEGYLPGDIVIIDKNVAPKPGDIVAAEVPAGREAAGTILRLFEPPYLMARAHDRQLEPLPILMDRSVNILGTATRLLREMRKAS